jgi:hypothetical protein
MESSRVWYFFSDEVPDSQVIVPFRTRHGLAFGVRRGATEDELLDALNETARFVLGVGLAHVDPSEEPPDSAPTEE